MTTTTTAAESARTTRATAGWKLWLARIVMFAVCGAMIVAFIRESISDPWLPVFTGALVGLGALAAIYPRVNRLIQTAFTGYMLFTVWMLIAIAPGAAAIWIARRIEAQSSVSLQATAFILWACVLSGAVWFLATEGRRTRLFKFLQPIGAFAPVAYAVNVLLIAIPFFGSLTRVLLARGAIHLTGDPERAMDFYLWHFLGAIPLLKVNETLLWDQPLAYHEARVGWLLLVFKAIVIIPVIAAFRGYWTYTHPKRSEVE
jgi:hypothetical protein